MSSRKRPSKSPAKRSKGAVLAALTVLPAAGVAGSTTTAGAAPVQTAAPARTNGDVGPAVSSPVACGSGFLATPSTNNQGSSTVRATRGNYTPLMLRVRVENANLLGGFAGTIEVNGERRGVVVPAAGSKTLEFEVWDFPASRRWSTFTWDVSYSSETDGLARVSTYTYDSCLPVQYNTRSCQAGGWKHSFKYQYINTSHGKWIAPYTASSEWNGDESAERPVTVAVTAMGTSLFPDYTTSKTFGSRSYTDWQSTGAFLTASFSVPYKGSTASCSVSL